MHQEITELLPGLRRFAYSLTGSMPDADDLLQNTVERLLVRSKPDDVDLTKWAFRVCRNVWIDECRARKVRREAADKPELSEGQIVNGEHHTTQQIEWNRVDAAMGKLPQEQRQIISLVAPAAGAFRKSRGGGGDCRFGDDPVAQYTGAERAGRAGTGRGAGARSQRPSLCPEFRRHADAAPDVSESGRRLVSSIPD